MKFCSNISLPTCLHIVCGCCCLRKAELSSCSSSVFTLCLFTETVCWSLPCTSDSYLMLNIIPTALPAYLPQLCPGILTVGVSFFFSCKSYTLYVYMFTIQEEIFWLHSLDSVTLNHLQSYSHLAGFLLVEFYVMAFLWCIEYTTIVLMPLYWAGSLQSCPFPSEGSTLSLNEHQ